MDSVAFSIGPLKATWYGILLASAFLIGYFLLKKLAKEKKIPEKVIDKYFLYLIFATLIGARLFHILFYNFSYFYANPLKIFYTWEGGLSSHGAIIANILMTLWFVKKNKLKFYDLADIVVIPFALGSIFIRFGNFINQELVGKATNSIFGYKFSNYQELRHPVQLYQAFSNLLLFNILYFTRKFQPFPGFTFWLFILLFSLFRFICDIFKDLPFYAGLTLAQYLSIPMFLISLVIFVKKWEKNIQLMKKNINM